MRELIVGDIVKCKEEILGNPEGSEGLVCFRETVLSDEGANIIFENGECDRLTQEEINEKIERSGHSEKLSKYKYEGDAKLYEDFDNGVFNEVFS